MLTLLATPFDVIKTNRILETSLAKEAKNDLGRELSTLYEHGGLQKGLFRDFSVTFASLFFFQTYLTDFNIPKILAISLLTNPL